MTGPKGYLYAGIAAGIKKEGLDLGLLWCQQEAVAVGFFTKNVNKSYSVLVSQRHLKHKIKALLVNSGNANCFTHSQGVMDTQALCRELGKLCGSNETQILIASTGIIGKKLPFPRVRRMLPALFAARSRQWNNFSQAMLTTDSRRKISSQSVEIDGKKVEILGFAKGAGMIHPHMATMLAFIVTDAGIERDVLNRMARCVVNDTFNVITIDSCMSTNDSVFFLANGCGAKVNKKDELSKFEKALFKVCFDLAKMIVKDAEGATKCIEVKVQQAATKKEAHQAAFFIAQSPLFKTAMYGQNTNWGRIVAALGQAGIAVNEDKFKVTATPLTRKEVTITVFLGRGKESLSVYTSDLTPEYVAINAGYS